jgi:site-specific DNA-methyltransferase (adenine-specific)
MSVLVGDCVEVMAGLEASSVDAVVCDPPYGLEFMGKDWDRLGDGFRRRNNAADVGRDDPFGRSSRTSPEYRAGPVAQAWHEAWAREALRVLKPGGHLLAFGGTRTYHRLMVGLEDAGFEIRDCLSWLYGSGFPKSLNIGNGRGTALKPAWEPIVVARKPLAGTVAGNVTEHGTGALNIDACRIGYEQGGSLASNPSLRESINGGNGGHVFPAEGERRVVTPHDAGRWPANVVLAHDEDCVLVGESSVRSNGHHPAARGASGYGSASDSGAGGLKGHEGLEERHADGEVVQRWACVPGCPVRMLDDQVGELVSGANPTRRSSDKFRLAYGDFVGQREITPARGVDRGGPSRFFYCAKAGREERNAGLDAFDKKPILWSSGEQNPGSFQAEGTDRSARNPHPTVKPIDLMRWLVRLVTPPGGRVLDPFMGSGTTGCAAALEGVEFVGVERDADYAAIAEARIRFWREHPTGLPVEQALEAEGMRRRVRESGQLGLDF